MSSVFTCCLYLFAQSRSSRISVSPSNIPNTAMRQAMNQTRAKSWRKGGVINNFYTGRLRPEVQPLTILYNIFHENLNEKGSPFVYLLLTNGTPSKKLSVSQRYKAKKFICSALWVLPQTQMTDFLPFHEPEA